MGEGVRQAAPEGSHDQRPTELERHIGLDHALASRALYSDGAEVLYDDGEDHRGTERITVEPGKMGGLACIRGLRIPVATVVAMVADGMTAEEIHGQYPSLPAEAVRAAIAYGALLAREELHPLEPMPR